MKTRPMKKDFKVGDYVGWNSEAGHVRGTIKRSEEHTSELQSLRHLACRLLLAKKTEKTFLTPRTASAPTNPSTATSLTRSWLRPSPLSFFFRPSPPTPCSPSFPSTPPS